jgi:hypothetical protein
MSPETNGLPEDRGQDDLRDYDLLDDMGDVRVTR